MENKKNVEFKPIKLTEEASKQITQIDEIMIGESTVGNQKIVLVNMITDTINSKKVKLEYVETNKITGIEKLVKFEGLNQIENKHIKGFVDVYKNYLGVNKFKLLSLLTKKPFIALGGISKINLKKINLTNSQGFAGISFFEQKKGP